MDGLGGVDSEGVVDWLRVVVVEGGIGVVGAVVVGAVVVGAAVVDTGVCETTGDS